MSAESERIWKLTRRHSSFYIGLYGQTWVKFMDDCWGLVEANAIKSQQTGVLFTGMRAMNLIMATF